MHSDDRIEVDIELEVLVPEGNLTDEEADALVFGFALNDGSLELAITYEAEPAPSWPG